MFIPFPMSETTEVDPTKDTGKFSPFAGCSIFIIAGCLALGMVAFTAWSYFKVKEKIEGFTLDQPKQIPLVDTKDKESEQTALKAKFVGFRHDIEAKNKGEMILNANEMNLAIATFDILKPHRNNFHITEIRNNEIEAQVSYPVKSRMGSDEMRYLTGSVIIVPELVEGGAFPRIIEIRADKDGDIPDEFKKFISETLLHPIVNDKELGPLFKSLSSVEIVGDKLMVTTDPSYIAPDAPEEKPTDSFLQKFVVGFGIVAVIFLAFVAMIIIISRRKAKQSPTTNK